jgi:virginiamycin B lyase
LGPGTDGALWSKGSGKVNRIATSGTITQYDAPGTGGGSITAGPDGALWYAGTFPGKIGRVTTSGSVTEYSAGADRLSGITAGPDGNIWFCAQSSANFIGRVNLSTAPPPTPTPPAAPLRGNVTPLAVRPPQSIVSPRP